jgi:hypothetical protein
MDLYAVKHNTHEVKIYGQKGWNNVSTEKAVVINYTDGSLNY